MRTKFENLSPPPAAEAVSPFAAYSAGSSVLQQPSLTPSRTADAKRYKFLRRFIHFRHMDFEYALWQMLHLFISPQKVYVYDYSLCALMIDAVGSPTTMKACSNNLKSFSFGDSSQPE